MRSGVRREHFDVVIVGSGPGGLMAALRSLGSRQRCLVVEAGPSLAERMRCRSDGDASGGALSSGFGGAGLFSDGKLCLSPRIGTTFSKRFLEGEIEHRQQAIDEAIRGGEDSPLWESDRKSVAHLDQQAGQLGLKYIHYPVRHVGSDQLPRMLARLHDLLVNRGATICCRTRCQHVRRSPRSSSWIVSLNRSDGLSTEVTAGYVVLAPGKVGSAWLHDLGLGLGRDTVLPKLGFRVEGPREFLDSIVRASNDPKLIMRAGNGAEARTHCVCYGGDVASAMYEDLVLVGGHSRSDHGAPRSNTAVIATDGYGGVVTPETVRDLARVVNRQANGQVGAQSLAAFLGTPEIDSPVVGFEPSLPNAPPVRFDQLYPPTIVDLGREFIRRLGAICPLAKHPGNMLYGPAVERWAARYSVSDEMESTEPGLFLVGDGPGLTGGIIGAAESGWLAGDAVTQRLAGSGTRTAVPLGFEKGLA